MELIRRWVLSHIAIPEELHSRGVNKGGFSVLYVAQKLIFLLVGNVSEEFRVTSNRNAQNLAYDARNTLVSCLDG